jgi:hypothetical protein
LSEKVLNVTTEITDRRFWIVGIGAAAMMAFAMMLVFMVHDQINPSRASLFAAVLIFAPVFLIARWALEPPSSLLAVPMWLFMTSLLAMGGVLAHPVAPRRGTAVLAVLGFAACATCMLMVAGSAV